jgi:hypothetical protein
LNTALVQSPIHIEVILIWATEVLMNFVPVILDEMAAFTFKC